LLKRADFQQLLQEDEAGFGKLMVILIEANKITGAE